MDDIVLLSGSVWKLQAMFNIFKEYSMIPDIIFNADKSTCLQIVNCGLDAPINLMLDGRVVFWKKR